MTMIWLVCAGCERVGEEGSIGRRPLSVFGRSVLEHSIGAGIRCGLDDFLVARSSAEPLDIPGVQDDQFDEGYATLYRALDDVEPTELVILVCAKVVYEHRILQELIDTPGDICVTVDASLQTYFPLRKALPAQRVNLSTAGSEVISIGSAVAGEPQADGQLVGLVKLTSQGVKLLRDTHAGLRASFHDSPGRSFIDLDHAPLAHMLQELIDRGSAIIASVIHGGWIELDTGVDYSVLNRVESGELSWLLREEALAGRPAISAGGVAVRMGGKGLEALLVGSGKSGEWRIPKGLVQTNETLELAAIREVQEETGVRCQISGFLGTARWPYHYDGLLYEKLVHFFLMEAIFSVNEHDREHAAVAWHPLENVEQLLLYDNERAIVRLASTRGCDVLPRSQR
jgi:8-oxo-dGTP pyrophosphatase MutT (NUDIX family)/choline kinase